MAGLEAPTAGGVAWPAFGGRPTERAALIGVVFQGASLIPSLDVAENVALPMIFGGTSPTEAETRALAALARLQLESLAHKLPEELSAGQSQRVAIARVLASRPRLILADEPTGQLDHVTAAEMIDVLLQTSSDLDAALVISTHDPLISARLDTQWTMHDGRLELRS
jgi:ABC-type lipoprotein export system ATPase subunit